MRSGDAADQASSLLVSIAQLSINNSIGGSSQQGESSTSPSANNAARSIAFSLLPHQKLSNRSPLAVIPDPANIVALDRENGSPDPEGVDTDLDDAVSDNQENTLVRRARSGTLTEQE